MDIAYLSNYIVLAVVGVCLCVGYIIKNIVPNESINKYIPLIMGVLGVALNVWINDAITPDVLLGGLVSGLSSTGLHQAFKSFLNKEG